MDNEEFLNTNSRFVAFMDVLGYYSLVSDTIPDTRKMHRLYSLFENLGEAVCKALQDDHERAVDALSFSDSYYFSSKDLPRLLSFLEQVFATAYGFQEWSYDKQPDNWVPFVRAGIVEGWAVSFRDATLNRLPQPECFRNPVGPAVAESYKLTEDRGKLPGMRCFLERDLLSRCSPTYIADPPHYQIVSGESKLRLLDVPANDLRQCDLQLVEVAWPCRVIASNNCSFHNPLAKCKAQFDVGTRDEKERKRRENHFIGTVDLFRRSVGICGDRHAVTVWDHHSGDLISAHEAGAGG
ncbi:MAG: hypothetical protein HYX78_05690 [Armatimonadetes bacterium]|nr:hypothetical protein [Armatimonadota bacterium]